MKLYLNSDIAEGTPEELVKYKELNHETKRKVDEEGFEAGNYSILNVEAQAPLTDIQEGENESVNENVEEELYDYYEVVNPDRFASSIKKGTILKRTSITYTGYDCSYINLVTSTGLAQKGLLKDSVIKPIIGSEFTTDRFDFAKRLGVMLTVDTDFELDRDIHFIPPKNIK